MNSSDFKDKRFLVVDYIKQSCEMLQQFVYHLGVQRTDTSYTGRDVILKCQENAYDVILLGYDLGEGKRNGQQVLEQLRVEGLIRRSTVIIIITAEISQEMVLAALEHKPDDYLTKPYSYKELNQRVSKAFSKKLVMSDIYQAMDDEDPIEVIGQCDKLLSQNTLYKTECLGIKSRQYFELEQYQEAQQIYTRYLNATNCQWAAIGMGKIALAAEEFELAVTRFQSVISRYPCYLSAYDWLAKAYKLQHDLLSAEAILEKAVKVSPRSVNRLKSYAELCLNNKHYDKSTDAYYKTYEVASNSIHHQPENILLFVKSLLLYADELPISDIEKLNHKAITALNVVNRDFVSNELKTQTKLLTARLYNKAKNPVASQDNSHQAVKLLNRKDNLFSSEGIMEIISSVQELDLEKEVFPAIQRLSQAHPDNSKLHAEVEGISAYPISAENITKAQSSLNIGIREYRNENYLPAIQNLQQALQLFPNHIGIKLNLLQVLLVAHEKGEGRREDIAIAKELIEEFGELAPNSESNLRLNVLKSRFEKLI